jgi:hypothetical protein|tara:strand:- start:7601 stop:8524 length:924 start_codon:yes stop_codon:yes gene_type:complete
MDYIKSKIESAIPYQGNEYISETKNFLESNNLIAKISFLILVIILFIGFFNLGIKIIRKLLTPSETPYIFYGMKSAKSLQIVPQRLDDKNSVPIFRSKNQHEGIEFTYSNWMYIQHLDDSSKQFYHVFNKGSVNKDSDGIMEPNNCPGVYIFNGTQEHDLFKDSVINSEDSLISMLILINVYNNEPDTVGNYTYLEKIFIDGVPIKKWINVIIRVNSQNIVDVYINGTLTKRHKLSNVIKQNYENININMNGGFDGFMSNLKYYNYSIGTFEIDSIVTSGPNLKMSDGSSIKTSKPYYLANDWFYSN